MPIADLRRALQEIRDAAKRVRDDGWEQQGKATAKTLEEQQPALDVDHGLNLSSKSLCTVISSDCTMWLISHKDRTKAPSSTVFAGQLAESTERLIARCDELLIAIQGMR